MSPQDFADYKSKYLDLYRQVKETNQKEKVSILDDIDFELELIHRDEINVRYILELLSRLKDSPQKEQEERKKQILQLLSGEAKLLSKKELIEKFIEENLPSIQDSVDVPEAFEEYWHEEQLKAFSALVKDESLIPDKTEQVIANYLYTERAPLTDDILNLMQEKPGILGKRQAAERIWDKVLRFVGTFLEGMAA